MSKAIKMLSWKNFATLLETPEYIYLYQTRHSYRITAKVKYGIFLRKEEVELIHTPPFGKFGNIFHMFHSFLLSFQIFFYSLISYNINQFFLNYNYPITFLLNLSCIRVNIAPLTVSLTIET